MPGITTVTSEAENNECSVLQQEEWDVLESIYPDYVSRDFITRLITVEAPVDLSYLRTVVVEDDGTIGSSAPVGLPPQGAASPDTTRHQELEVSALPPLLLTIALPREYPMRRAPQLLSLRATHSWLPLRDLSDKLLAVWQEGEGVLFSWVEWIQSGTFLEDLGLVDVDGVIRIPHPAPHLLVPSLVEYDATLRSSRFSQMSYACSVCLTSVKGARCILLSCAHVFCRGCLEDFWKLCITEGEVGRVGCPDPACVKDGREANEEEVRRVVTEDEVQRWKWLRQKKMIEKDPTIIHCPVSVCQAPVPGPKNYTESDEATGWERLRSCSQCGYNFCSFCRRTWHGPISDCVMASADAFVTEYLATSEGSEARRILEQRYGRRTIARLVEKYHEDMANKEWLEKSTMACPFCHVHVEKSMGCNHMTCGKCKQHFCYRCGVKLNPNEPYAHFSKPGPCFSKLFDFNPTEEEDGWQPMAGFDAL